MTAQLLRPSDYRSMPWRNGGGVTHEIALKEAEGGFLWRLSLAEVGQSGPFSAFPGLARILTVIEGQGIRLIEAGGGKILEALPLRPVAFSGDSPIQGELVAGPIRDLNLIYDPRRYRGAVALLEGGSEIAAAEGREQALFVVSGSLELAAGERLSAGETLLLGPGEGVSLRAGTTLVQALLATLTPL